MAENTPDRDDNLLGEQDTPEGARVGADGSEVVLREADHEQVGHTTQDEFFDAFGEPEPSVIGINPADGLVDHVDTKDARAVPPLSVDTLVCLEDTSSFVTLATEDIDAYLLSRQSVSGPLQDLAYRTRLVTNLRSYTHWRLDAFGNPDPTFPGKTYAPAEVEDNGVIHFVREGGRMILVRPVRMRCSHLERMLTISDELSTKVSPLHTYCKGFRSVGGAKMSLMDQAILACEVRQPPDDRSGKAIVERVEAKIAQGKEKKGLPMYKKALPQESWESVAARVTDNHWPGEFGSVPLANVARVATDRSRAREPASYVDVVSPTKVVEYLGRFVDERDPKSMTLVVVGTDWLPPEGFFPAVADYNVVRIDPKDFTADPHPDWCASWPQNAAFPALDLNLRRLSAYVADRNLGGHDTVIVSSHADWALFFAELVAIQVGTQATFDKQYLCQTPELRSYADRLALVRHPTEPIPAAPEATPTTEGNI